MSRKEDDFTVSTFKVNGQLTPTGGGDPIPLLRPKLVIGRLDSCDICLRMPNVSKNHCQLAFIDGFWWIYDLGSTNGVKVNGTRVPKHILRPGDVITIAKRQYTIDYNPPVGQRVLDELLEDDPMKIPLLEKAGLVRPRRPNDPVRPKQPPPLPFGDDDDDDDD